MASQPISSSLCFFVLQSSSLCLSFPFLCCESCNVVSFATFPSLLNGIYSLCNGNVSHTSTSLSDIGHNLLTVSHRSNSH